MGSDSPHDPVRAESHVVKVIGHALANAVSVMSNILATFLREACPHVGAHFWVRLPVAYLYFCVRTFCVNISTGHAARPAHGDPIWLRLHIFALVCRGVIRHI